MPIIDSASGAYQHSNDWGCISCLKSLSPTMQPAWAAVDFFGRKAYIVFKFSNKSLNIFEFTKSLQYIMRLKNQIKISTFNMQGGVNKKKTSLAWYAEI